MRGPTPRFYLGFGSTWTTLDAAISWTEVTAYVMSERGAGGRRGRSSELDDMIAGTFNCTLNNTDRRFDPMHTGSPYYATYLNLTGASGSYASTPDVAALDITGDLEMRVGFESGFDETPAAEATLVGKWNATGDNRSYRLVLRTTGTLMLQTTTAGTVGSLVPQESTASVPAGTLHVRATIDVNDGGGNRVVRFYTSSDVTNDHSLVSWTQLGSTVTTAGATTVYSSSATLDVGAHNAGTAGQVLGGIRYAAVLNGIGGTVVADPVFAIGLGLGATSVTDSTGKVWTVNSPATITGTTSHLKPGVPFKVTGTANSTEYPVFRGFVGGWPQDYDVSNRLGFVNVQCTDGMAKLATAGTRSSVYALEVAADSPKGWWRLSESAGTSATEASTNGYSGTWDTDASRVHSTSHPNAWETVGAADLTDPARRVVVTDNDALITTGDFTVEFLCRFDEDGSAVFRDLLTSYSSGRGWRLQTDAAGGVDFRAPGGTNTYAAASAPTLRDGVPHVVTVRKAGGTVEFYIDGVNYTPSIGGAGLNVPGQAFIIHGTKDSFTDAEPGVLADVSVYAADLGAVRVAAHHDAFLAPWDGDTTGERIDRILGFGWPSDLIDTATGYTLLGPATLGQNQLALIKSYEKAEQGRFFIAKDGKATFRDRYYNQLVTAGSTSQATFSDDGSDNPYGAFAFDYDDRLVYNRVRASRTGGGTIEVFDEDSIEAYGEQVDSSLTGIQVGTDALVRGVAELRLDRYKDPQLRVRPIEMKLHGLTAAQQADVLDLELGYRVTVERTPQDVGSAISQETVVEGIAHRISGGQWTTTLTLSPVDTRAYGLWGDNWDEALWGY